MKMGCSRSRSLERRRDRLSNNHDCSPDPKDDGVRVHVTDLGLDPSKRDIESSFEKFGKLLEVWVAKNPPHFAFVIYKYREDAEAAIKEMNGKVFGSGPIRVSLARPRTRGQHRRVFSPYFYCYQCGRKGHFFRDCDDSRRFTRRQYMIRSPSHSYSRSCGRRCKNEKHRSSQTGRSRSPSRPLKRSSKSKCIPKSESRSPGQRCNPRSKQGNNSPEKEESQSKDCKRSLEREQRFKSTENTKLLNPSVDGLSHNETSSTLSSTPPNLK